MILLATLLSGCATAHFDARACPTIRGYTKAQMTALADELVKAGPALQSMAVDYLKLRDKVRACRGAK